MQKDMLSETQLVGLERYITALETLSAEGIDDLVAMMASNYHFIDPFNDLVGINAGRAIFTEMLGNTESLTFKVQTRWDSETGCVIGWTLDLVTKPILFFPSQWHFNGLSEIAVGSDGRITKHHDYWDSGSQFYATIPILGMFVRIMRRKVATKIVPY